MTTTEELNLLFAAAVGAGGDAAASAFADRLSELWPQVMAKWSAEMDRINRVLADEGLPTRVEYEDVPLLDLWSKATETQRFTLTVVMVDADPDEPAPYRVEWRGEWSDLYVGHHTPGRLTTAPPDQWPARDAAAVVEYLTDLAGLPDEIDAALP